jgi:uncharacterized protein
MKPPARIVLVSLSLLLAGGGCGSGAAPPAEAALHSDSATQAAGEELRVQGRVTDAAGILAPDVETRLARKLEALEQQTGHQMVLATTPSLNGEEISDYAQKLGNRWGIGRKEHDDGVIILVAPNERKVRIAVGYGLEKTLTNAFCGQVIADDMLPRFKEGDFAAGVEAGVAAISAKIS